MGSEARSAAPMDRRQSRSPRCRSGLQPHGQGMITLSPPRQSGVTRRATSPPTCRPPRLNRGSKLSLSRRRRVRARSRGGTDRPSTQIPPSLASSVNCQAFIPPQVDDPLNLAGVNSSLQKMQPSCLPEVICHDLIVSPSLALDMMSKSCTYLRSSSPRRSCTYIRHASSRRTEKFEC